MSDTSTQIEPNSEDDNVDLPEGARQRLRAVEAENKRLKAESASNAVAEKELALYKAGLGELSPKQQKALFATHEGELTPEALLTSAEELGYASPKPEVDPAVQEAHEAIANASKGASTSPAVEDYDDAVANAGSWDEVLQIVKEKGEAPVDNSTFS